MESWLALMFAPKALYWVHAVTICWSTERRAEVDLDARLPEQFLLLAHPSGCRAALVERHGDLRLDAGAAHAGIVAEEGSLHIHAGKQGAFGRLHLIAVGVHVVLRRQDARIVGPPHGKRLGERPREEARRSRRHRHSNRRVADDLHIDRLAGLLLRDRSLQKGLRGGELRLRLRDVRPGALADLEAGIRSLQLFAQELQVLATDVDDFLVACDVDIGLRGRLENVDLGGKQLLATGEHVQFGCADVVQRLESVKDRLREGELDLGRLLIRPLQG